VFYSSNQYPSLAHLPVAERKRVVALATKSQNPWIGRRFAVVLAVLALGSVILGFAMPELSNSETLVLAVVAGLVFYFYMLVEINGPIRRAVETHLSDARSSQEKRRK